MAKSANTWCKKLMAKGKRHALGVKLGTFKPRSVSSTLDGEIENKPKEREYYAPVKSSYVPCKGPRGGARLNARTREILAARREARDDFIRALSAR